MFEIYFNDIAVGNRVAGDYAEGHVTEVGNGWVTVDWEGEGPQTYTEDEFQEYGFTVYVN